MPHTPNAPRAEQPVQQINRYTLDQLNTTPVTLERDSFGNEEVWLDIPDADMGQFIKPTEKYQTDVEGDDYRTGAPMLSIVTGGQKPENQVTYTLMAEISEQGPTGEIHIVGKNFVGDQIDFAVLGSPAVQVNSVFLGREYKHGEKTVRGPEIPDTVSRKAVGVSYVRDRQYETTIVSIRDNSLNGTEVKGPQTDTMPEITSPPESQREHVAKGAGSRLLKRLGRVE